MAPIEKRREVFTDLLRKRIENAKTKPLEKKKEERVIRKKLASRERAVVVAKARAKEMVLSRFHKEYVKKPLKAIEREMIVIKEKIKYLEGQRKKVKSKGKVTLESNIRALNARLSVLGNIRKEVIVKSTNSKAKVPTKTFVHQPEQQAVVRRQGELVRGNSASPKPAKIGIENIQSPREAIFAINGLVDRVIGTEQSSDMEATNKTLSQFSVGLEAKMNGVFRGFNEKRVSMGELNGYYTNIDAILRKAYANPDKVIPLGRLEALKRKLEGILFPEGKGNGKAQIRVPVIVTKVPEAVAPGKKGPEKGSAREPEAVVASRSAFDVESALTELRAMLRNVHVDVRLILAKLNELPERAQQTVIVDVVNFALRESNTTLLQSIEVHFGNRFEQVINDQRKVFAEITELMTGFKGGFARDRQAIIAELQDLSRVVKEANTSAKVERVVERLSSLEKYFETDAFKKIITEAIKDANKTGNTALRTEIRDKFEELIKGMEEVRKAEVDTAKAVRDTFANLETKLQEATEKLLESLKKEYKENKDGQENILKLLNEIGEYILNADMENKAVLSEIKNELIELEKFFEKDAFKRYLLEVLETAFVVERPLLVDAIMTEFEARYPDLKDLKTRFDRIEILVQAVGDEVKVEIVAEAYKLSLLLDQINNKVTPLDPKLDAIAQKIDALSTKLDPAALATFLEAALLPGIRNAIEDGNNSLYKDLVAKMGNRFNELKNQNLNLKKLIIKLSNREEQRYVKIKKLLEGLKDQSEENQREIIDRLWDVFSAVDKGNKVSEETLQRLKTLETFFEPTAYKAFLKTIVDENNSALIAMMKADPFFKDKIDKAYIDAKFEEITKLIKEDKTKEAEKKPEVKKEEGWWKKYGPPTAGMGFVILLVGLVLFLIIQALRNSGGGPSGGIPSTAVVPIIGETAKAAGSSGLSSILGPLGGINPIIIILILVALFLLFPKK